MSESLAVILTKEQELQNYLAKSLDYNDRLQLKYLLSIIDAKYGELSISQLRTIIAKQ